MPRARVQFHKELAAAVRANPLRLIVPKTFIRDFAGYVIYIGAQEGPVFRDIWLWELDAQRRVRRVVHAESGRIDYDEATNSLIPTLTRATVEERDPADPEDFSKAPRVVTVGRFEEVRIPLDRYMGQHFVRVKEEWLPYGELQELRARNVSGAVEGLAIRREKDAHRPAALAVHRHERSFDATCLGPATNEKRRHDGRRLYARQA